MRAPQADASSPERLTIAVLYYANPRLLLRHLSVVVSYPQEVRDRLNYMVMDDCSPRALEAARYITAAHISSVQILVYRIQTDLAWNIGGARNLAFHVSPTSRVLLLDVDVMLPLAAAQGAIALIDREGADTPVVHRFNRRRPSGELKLSPALAR